MPNDWTARTGDSNDDGFTVLLHRAGSTQETLLEHRPDHEAGTIVRPGHCDGRWQNDRQPSTDGFDVGNLYDHVEPVARWV